MDKILEILSKLPPDFFEWVRRVLEGGAGTLEEAREALRRMAVFLDTLTALLDEVRAWMEVGRWTANVAVDWLIHWCWSSLAGVLAYTATYSVTAWTLKCVVFRGRSRISWEGPLARDISNLCMCSLLFGSWLLHDWWDGLLF